MLRAWAARSDSPTFICFSRSHTSNHLAICRTHTLHQPPASSSLCPTSATRTSPLQSATTNASSPPKRANPAHKMHTTQPQTSTQHPFLSQQLRHCVLSSSDVGSMKRESLRSVDLIRMGWRGYCGSEGGKYGVGGSLCVSVMEVSGPVCRGMEKEHPLCSLTRIPPVFRKKSPLLSACTQRHSQDE